MMVLDLGCHYMARILCYVPDCIKHSNCFNSQISHSTVFVASGPWLRWLRGGV
jgi:hypothetical protein